MNSYPMKALVLFSGGLDSMLAIKLLREQNIDVVALHINIGFNSKKENVTALEQRATLAGAPLEIIDVRNTYLQEVLLAHVMVMESSLTPASIVTALCLKSPLPCFQNTTLLLSPQVKSSVNVL